MMTLKSILTTAFLILPLTLSAQMQNRQRPVDTLVTTDGLQRVVLFSNGTWKYIGLGDQKEQQKVEEAKIAAAKTPAPTVGNVENPTIQDTTITSDVFDSSWEESSLSAYHTSLSDLPAIIDIKLCSGDSTSYRCPYVGRVSSRYGYRHGRRHTGTDIPLSTGDPIRAAFNGKVRIAKSGAGGYGRLIIIRHANGLETYYGHLSRIMVEPGDVVRAGDVIALGGNSGRSTGPHLHFEVRYQGFPFDAERIFDFTTGEIREIDFELRQSYFGANSRYAASGNRTAAKPASDGTAQTEKAEDEPVYHRVVSGDNLSRIANKYGTTVNEICRLNNIKSTTILSIGRSLRVK